MFEVDNGRGGIPTVYLVVHSFYQYNLELSYKYKFQLIETFILQSKSR